ncbi:putative translation regulator (Cya5) [Aspergillus affinis]|uniref:putative translation regulator (Cya5) n=1 Tax=Aspergillus affinis TaxID=1070780 RepID=UPI0022FE493F|nr:MCM-domain-containing protein [Aspergillus affinis]KAI9043297.1 MCM-domain-containing protein [Aspergillus affinis]
MLERAAGCLENAGRRFFRDSNGMIRGPKSFNSGSGKNNIASVECLRWLLISLRTKLTRPSNALGGNSSSGTVTNDARSPFLEFLYPPHAQEVVTSCLLRTPRRLPPRRRKKAISGLSRNYATQAIGLRQSASECKPEDETIKELGETSEARRKLGTLLANAKLGQYDEAWTLYVALGHPEDMTSPLLAYLSSSAHAVDCRRAKRLFDGISVDSRSAEDYLHLARSYHSNELATEMISICKEAISKHRGHNCWAFTLANLFAAANWEALQDIWQSKPTSSEDQLWSLLMPQLSAPDFAQNLLALSTYLDGGDADVSLRGLSSFFLAHVFTSRDVVENIPTENLLLLLRKYHALDILTPRNYLDLIETFHSSDIRSTFVKSILVYRNFRWQLQGEVPPSKILGKLIERLAALEITAGVQYLLDEFTQFYRKPSIYAYRNALLAFSRAGDVQNVTRLFDRYLLDHGKPLSRKLITPILYVHASAGDVKSTLHHFNRISEEFGLTPNTICWNIVLTAHARSDNFNGAFETFKTMLEYQIEPNSHTFGTLMGLSANRGDIETVRQLLVLAKKKQVQITTPLLDTVVEAYCKNNRLDLAESVAETCLDLRVKGSRLRMWNLLLWNHAFRLNLDAISRIRSRMDAIGLAPDEMTYGALMLGLVLINQTDSARRILRTLHRSRRIFASEFHYTIILYGYVKARNRDMVHIIFREIKERFNKPGLSSHLLVLRTQLYRDLQLAQDGGEEADAAQVRLEYAEKFLSKTLVEFDRTKLASKQPLPGAGSRSPSNAFPVVYFEHIINAYGTRGASKRARELFDEYLTAADVPEEAAPIRLISALMLAHLKGGEYQKVEECWNMVLPRARLLASRFNVDEWLSTKQPPTADATEVGPPQPSLPISVRSELEGVLQSATSEAPWPRKSALPSYRFWISRPLSLYMRSLAYRNEAWKIPQLASDIKKAGFSLTTFNWSTMVQMLASSDRPSDQAEAFTIFETKFMPNFPGWKNLRRSYGLKPDGVPDSIDLMEKPNRSKPPHVLGKEGRRYWSNIQPGFLQPTYISMVYLASSLLRFRERSLYDGSAEVKALYREAPRTIKAIANMPLLRDKFQGVLLRRRQERSDKKNYASGSQHFVWTGGILGVGGRRRAIPQPEKADDDQYDEEGLEEDEEANETAETGEIAGTEKTEKEKEAEALALQFAHVRPDPDNTTEVAEDSFIIDETLSFDNNTSEPPEQIIDSQDEYDIETESLLEARRIADGVIDEVFDVEQRDSPDENDQQDDNSPSLEKEDQPPEGELFEKNDEDSR